MSETYILDGRTPVECADETKWGNWLKTSGETRRVAEDRIDGSYISTVFLGLDHSFSSGHRLPLLFETLVFGGPLDGELERCSTWAEAEVMHAKMVARVTASV
jgi:hypothetical protein